jgi:hypothetical protein
LSDGQQAQEPSDPLLRVVAEYWEEIEESASEEQRERLRALVAGAAEPDPVEARAAIADELLDILPGDHQVIRVLRTRVLYGSGVRTPGPDQLTDALRRLAKLVLPAGEAVWPDHENGEAVVVPPEPMATDEFDRRVQARLLGLPALSPDDLDREQAGPVGPHLIRLPRPDRTWQLPAFQFTNAGRPWPIVEEVNELMDADTDPWGVTCWWVDPHEVLNAAPAELLGTGQDALIRRAAIEAGEEL